VVGGLRLLIAPVAKAGRVGLGRYRNYASEACRQTVRRESFAAMRKLNLYYGTVKSATNRQHFMAWANSREQALDLVEAALTATEPVLGSVVGPITSLPADVMKPGVFVEVMAPPED
jgi:hypothetical protein